MGKATPHKKVKLFIGFIFNDNNALKRALEITVKKWGPVDSETDMLDFCGTDYYQKEMGDRLKKKIISMKQLVRPEDICNVKIETDRIERMLSKSKNRLINMDPGYITESKLILLTTKDYGHRIYLRRGIYAEVTLKFQKGSFVPLETTYPDYKKEEYIGFFNNARGIYREDLR